MLASILALFMAMMASVVVALPSALPAPVAIPVPNFGKKLDGYPQFNLRTEVQGQDNPDANNLLVSIFHTGAGLNAAIGTANQTRAVPFVYKDDEIQFTVEQGNGQSIPYAFGLPHVSSYMSNAPSSYNVVEVSVIDHTAGFIINNDYVEHPDTDFKTFAMCYVNGTAPYVSLGPQYQLFWKNESSVAGAGNCADVKLKTVYLMD